MFFTSICATHVSIITFDISDYSSEQSSLIYKTVCYLYSLEPLYDTRSLSNVSSVYSFRPLYFWRIKALLGFALQSQAKFDQ